MSVVGIIPARGGSRGIPRKNIRLIAEKPLIAWTIEASLRSGVLDAVVVTTDDEEIASVARQYGADVPFLRPAELARDETPGADPILHALEQLPTYDEFVMLQPTSPLRATEDIDACVALANVQQADSVVSVTEPSKHPYWMYRLGERLRLEPLIDAPLVPRRQDLPPVYALNGALFYARTEWFQRQRRFVTAETVGYVMPYERSIDLDTMVDWKLAELLLLQREVGVTA